MPMASIRVVPAGLLAAIWSGRWVLWPTDPPLSLHVRFVGTYQTKHFGSCRSATPREPQLTLRKFEFSEQKVSF